VFIEWMVFFGQDRQYGVDYVYHGPREKVLGGFDPGRVAYLRLTYDNGEVQIYRVERGK
jgi:hypothetical protein